MISREACLRSLGGPGTYLAHFLSRHSLKSKSLMSARREETWLADRQVGLSRTFLVRFAGRTGRLMNQVVDVSISRLLFLFPAYNCILSLAVSLLSTQQSLYVGEDDNEDSSQEGGKG